MHCKKTEISWCTHWFQKVIKYTKVKVQSFPFGGKKEGRHLSDEGICPDMRWSFKSLHSLPGGYVFRLQDLENVVMSSDFFYIFDAFRLGCIASSFHI